MKVRLLLPLVIAFGMLAAPASAFHDGDADSSLMQPVFESKNPREMTNSDMAYWGDRAYVGDYGGARIFDVSNPATPAQIGNIECDGPQNDPVVWQNKLLFLAVDRTMEGPECGAPRSAAHDDPDGWEGVRIFDVSNPAAPRQIKTVYTDCGAHTITLWPQNRKQPESSKWINLWVSSYPLRPGPTCGPVRGPENGNSPLHEKIQVIRVPLDKPEKARVIAEPKISYPGDPDHKFEPEEHAFPPGFNPLTACHDIGVFVQLRLAAGACAEQAQLWRVNGNGVPDTKKPLWVFDDNVDTDGPGGAHSDPAVDFWHSATFSQDGKVVNFIDESFGLGCPPKTPNYMNTGQTADTGWMFFLDTRTGRKLSHFMYDRPGPDETAPDPTTGDETAYCSAHLGNTVRARDKDLLVNAWYMGGADVIDFSDPRNPEEIAFWDYPPAGPTGSDNWSAYWYEGPQLPEDSLTVYGTDGVHNPPTGRGFQVFRAAIAADEDPLRYLNPQTQEFTLGDPVGKVKRQKPKRFGSAARKGKSARTTGNRRAARAAARRLAP